MQTIKLQQRGVLTLPKKLRESLNLYEGQSLRVVQDGKKIVLELESDIDTQLAEDIRQGLKDIRSGDYIEFGSLEEFDKEIKKYEN